MAIIYSYPTVAPAKTDLVLGTDVSANGQPTKNFSIQGIIDLVTVATGDLQTVLDLGEIAVGKDIVLGTRVIPTQTMYAGTFTTGSAIIAGAIGTGFTDFTSTRITGTIQAASAAQPNITSLGNLTALVIDGAVSGTNVITSTTLVGASNTNIVSTLAIKTYVDSNPAGAESLAATLLIGNTTSGTDIVVSAGDDATFTNTSKILMGTTAVDNFEIYSDSLNSIVIDRSPGALKLQTSLLSLKNEADTETILSGTAGAAVDLYFNNAKKFETTTTGVLVTGVVDVPAGAVGTPSYTFTGDLDTGIYLPAANTVGIAGGGVLGFTVDATDTVVEGNLTINGTFVSGSTAQASFGGQVTIPLVPSASTDAASKGYVDTSGAATSLDYAGDATGPFALNLATDDLEFNGDSNITVTAATVTGTKGIVTIDLNDDVTITGTMTADTFETTAGTASWSTTVMTGFTSITSTLFIGALQGNADSATALAASGQIQLSGDTTSALAYTYTSGGAINIATSIADTVVTGKVLTSLSTATAQTIVATDTILEAFGYLQATITGLPSGLDYIGTWDARTVAEGGGSDGGTPDLRTAGLQVPGHYYIVATAGSATPNGAATTPSEWKIGDWVMRADATISEWQKIDNTSTIDGTGVANKIARWTGTQTLGTGLIDDDGTDVTIGTSGNLIVEGDSTLGAGSSDSTLVKGQLDVEANFIARQGIGLGLVPAYGSSGQVLTSGGNSSTACTWTTPTTGTVTSVGLTETGSALTITGSPITSSGTLNIAGAGTAAQYINGALDLVTFPTLDNYVSWTADSDEGTDITVTTGFNLKFTGAVTAGGAGISTDSAISANEMTIGLINAGGTPGVTTFYRGDGQWTVPVGTKTETLAEVLVNGNTTGVTKISVNNSSSGVDLIDDTKIRFGDIAGTPDLEIYHTAGANSIIKATVTSPTAGPLLIQSDNLELQASSVSEKFLTTSVNAELNLFYNNVKKFETTATGVTVTGALTATAAGTAGIFNSGATNVVASFTSTDATGVIQCVDNAGNVEFGASGDCFVVQPAGGTTQLTVCSTSSTFAGDLTVDGDLTVGGSIIHGGGGGGTAKGGTFTKMYTTGAIGASGIAFTITRATGAAMVFDVMFTGGGLGSGTSTCKKYTVVKKYGLTTASIYYNKIIDTGPALGGSGTADYDILFDVSGSAGEAIECNITAVGVAAQQIGITMDLGFGKQDAVVVMN